MAWKFGMRFFGVRFWSGEFFWILFEALGILGVLISAPIQLCIPVTLNPEYYPTV